MDSTSSRIKLIRKTSNRQLSQVQVAKELHIAQSTYARFESGLREPPLSFIKDFCKLFHVSSDYLLGLSDHPSPSSYSLNAIPTISVARDPLDDLLPSYREQAETYLAFLRQQQAAETAASDKRPV